MERRTIAVPAALVKLALPFALLVVFLGGWYFGLPERPGGGAPGDDSVWTCSMHPQVRQPQPGLCPICEMDLIPLQPGGGTGLREVEVTPEAAALMDLRVSPVRRGEAAVELHLFGKIAYDEREVTTTTARMGGRLDRFYIDHTGTRVRKGDHIAEIYSPELFVAQGDLIEAARGLAQARRAGTAAAVATQGRLLRSARERLRLLQLSDAQIDAIAEQGAPSDHVTLFAPQDGVVTERRVVEGAYVKTGDPLFSVAGLDSVWLNLEAYESDLPWLRFAQDVAFRVEAVPGEVFHGRIAYIDPELDEARRVARVRVNVDNGKGLLKPGMFARAKVGARLAGDGAIIDPDLAGKWVSPMHPEVISDGPGECPVCGMDLVPAAELGFVAGPAGRGGDSLLVPAAAVLQTGERAVVYVRLEGAPAPVFEGREVVLGARLGGEFVVLSGLAEGELVVTRGAFKLDSELQLKARPSMMNRDAGLRERPAAEAEAALFGQWGAVPRGLWRLREAAMAGEAEAVRAELATLGAALDRVETAAFHPLTLDLWAEFSMRLKNALAVARRDLDEGDLPATYRVLRHAIEEAGRHLGLPYQPAESPSDLGGGELAALRETLDAYLRFAAALAADDEGAAKLALPPLAERLGEVAGGRLASAGDLAAMRDALRPVSGSLTARVRQGGADRVGVLYRVHCPMVKGYEGGDWLSARPVVENPYFGAEMFDCGTVVENLSFEVKR